jgi:hypothetical protein
LEPLRQWTRMRKSLKLSKTTATILEQSIVWILDLRGSRLLVYEESYWRE